MACGARSIQLHIPCARRVLDLGCGTGWVTAEAIVEGNPVRVGLDCSLDSIQGRAGNPEPRVSADIRFVQGNGTMLPFADAVFDVVIGHVSMPYMDTRRALAEIYRVLAPGGSLLLTFHSFDYLWFAFQRSIRSGNWKNSVFLIYVGLNGLLNHFGLPQARWPFGRFETINTAHGVARTAQKAGFVMVSVEHVRKRIFFATTARRPDQERNAVRPAPSWAAYCELVNDADKLVDVSADRIA